MNVLCVVLIYSMMNGQPARVAQKLHGKVVKGTTELWLVDFSENFLDLGIDSSMNDKVQLMDDDVCMRINYE